MVTNVEGYLQLGSIIVEYIEQIESNRPTASNKKQALDHGMHLEDNTNKGTQGGSNQLVPDGNNNKPKTNLSNINYSHIRVDSS